MQVFTKQFMEQFDQEHAEAFGPGTKAPDAGFPDTGCGRFSKKLSYADWFKMNNGQRVQINFLEHITFAIAGPVIAAAAYPWFALSCAILIIVGRLLFSIGYTMGGPAGRVAGAICMDIGLFVSFGGMVAACFKLGINQ